MEIKIIDKEYGLHINIKRLLKNVNNIKIIIYFIKIFIWAIFSNTSFYFFITKIAIKKKENDQNNPFLF